MPLTVPEQNKEDLLELSRMASRLKVFEDQGDRKSVFLKELAKKYDVEGSGTITGDDLDKVVNDVMTLMKDKQYLEGTNKEMEDHIEALSHKVLSRRHTYYRTAQRFCIVPRNLSNRLSRCHSRHFRSYQTPNPR